jgi:hypothetical protein
MSEKLSEALRDFLKNGKDWERKPTTVPGIFILKLPKYKRVPPRLVVELNPVDEYGRPTKRRGLILRNYRDLKMYRELIDSDRLDKLLKVLDGINPTVHEEGAGEALEI